MANSKKGLVLFQQDQAAAEIAGQPREVSNIYAGICTSCAHTRGCTFLRSAGRPVIQCEEWSMDASGEAFLMEEPFDPAERTRPLTATNPLPRGLCATCEEYTTCAFMKPESGVWHCEEYR